ncbi:MULTISPECIES: PA14 domain-containing protein [unclassified Caldibacillus]|uniref:PA14 domain-containing protein n=2 Tax=Bacteria TaxID=2 RepID=UPI002814F2CA|nr:MULTISPECIES: PA14 domain-containing protein [unclassified Caldibacillus]
MKKLNIFSMALAGLFFIGSLYLVDNVKASEITSGKWTANIYPKPDFQGTPYVFETNKIDYDWNLSSPHASIPSDNFSARFIKTFTANEDLMINYKAWADDRVRVYLDGELIINAWNNSAYSLRGEVNQSVKKGSHTLVVEYYEEGNKAALKFTDQVYPVLKVSTENVHYNWGLGGPSGYPSDYFVAMFNQSRSFDGKEYFAQTYADDGVRLKVDGTYKINRWSSSSGEIVRSILGKLSGKHEIQTDYYEQTGYATVYSDIVPFGNWLVYYYNNLNLSGNPVNAEIIKADSKGWLTDNNGSNSPISKVNADNYSAKYVTAKRISAGDYILRIKRDDLVRVYIDGQLVFDGWKPRVRDDAAIKLTLNNKDGSDIHWIEIDYGEQTGLSNLEFCLEPYSIPTNKWLGEFYPNMNFQGNATVVETDNIDYNWQLSSPSADIPVDGFTARFTKSFTLKDDVVMNFSTWADDRVRVYLDGSLIIDGWKNSVYTLKGDVKQFVAKGTHTLKVEYLEDGNQAALKFKDLIFPMYKPSSSTVHYNWGTGGPTGFSSDYFAAIFNQSKKFDGKEYFAQTYADDGVRLKVDGNYKINRWSNSSGKIDRSILGQLSGEHSVQTEYYEHTGHATVYSDIVPFGDWLVYYYNNTDLSGNPVNAEVIKANSNGWLTDNNGTNAPITKVNADNFSARYVTAKRIDPGDYILRLTRDDLIRVYVDGSLVFDGWKPRSRDDAAIKLNISNKNGSNIHWIEIEYAEQLGASKVELSLEPYKVPNGKWLGEFYPNTNFQGIASIVETNKIDYNWGLSSPNENIPSDNFTARFTKSFTLDKDVMMNFSAWADDRVRVYLDNELIINAWENTAFTLKGNIKQLVKKGIHTLKVEYLEAGHQAALKFTDEVNPIYNETVTNVHYNWGTGGPSGFPTDNFYAIFDQSRNFDGKEYFAQTFADDGVRLKVDGAYKIDQWSNASGKIEKTILGQLTGKHSVLTEYYEQTGNAAVYSDIVPFGDWLVYYYNNTNLSGNPVNAEIISANSNGWLTDNNGANAPIAKVNSDNFSARYVTAKRIDAGDYILRLVRDDLIRVYLDGELVFDGWKTRASDDAAIKLSVKNKDNSNIHWIEIEYAEQTGNSKVELSLEPYTIPSDKWVGEVYSNQNLQGMPYIIEANSINYNWQNGSPIWGVPSDNFSVRFQRNINITESGIYKLNISADDGVRVYIDNQLYIDSWIQSAGYQPYQYVNLSKGVHSVKVEYYEATGLAKVQFSLEPIEFDYYEKTRDVFHNWGTNSPAQGIPADNFTALFDQSGYYDGNEYFGVTYADDGVRLLLNDERKIDRWSASAGQIDTAFLGQISGYNNVETQYMEQGNNAFIASNIVPVGNWVAYYYNNINLSGYPVNKTVVSSESNGNLYQNYGLNAPLANVNADNFSARFVTLKHLSEGTYKIKTNSDDGIRVLVDGEVVIDRWTAGNNVEDTAKITIKNKNTSNANEKDVHVIEVQYLELTNNSKFEFSIQPYTGSTISVKYTNYNRNFNDVLTIQANSSPKVDGAGLFTASRELVQYYMNPNNFSLGSTDFYQFLDLSQSAGLDVNEINQRVLSGKGSLAGKAQAFIDAGKESGINEVYLIAHALHETSNGTSTLAKGVPVDANGNVVSADKAKYTVYNMYGYGATDNNPLQGGAKYAFDRGWFSPEAAIKGGAALIGRGYINTGQNTLYKMRWNPANPGTHQYATHVQWATAQTTRIQQIYSLLDNYTLVFDVPVYNNQPAASPKPTGESQYAVLPVSSGAGKVTATTLNFRNYPNGPIIGALPYNTAVSILGKNGGWYKISVSGQTGWVSGDYIKLN